MELSPKQLEELLARSSMGEGVRSVLEEFGLDDDATLESLKQHHNALKAAKVEYRKTGPVSSEVRAAKLSVVRGGKV